MTSRNAPHESLHPERALLTPTWLGALALLVANDHWLKGADLIPGVLTGKLSDFAGMLVAPALLATLLRARSPRALLACHVAVAVVFSGIQLSPSFAGLWSGAMGLLGHPWVITCDPTDLLALPFLWLSWSLLTPAMAADRPALVGLRRTATAAASVFGLWATVATSDDGGGAEGCESCWDDTGGWDDTGEGGGWEEIYGQVYVHNPNDFAINLNVRILRQDVDFDCNAIASDPGRLLPDEAFGDVQNWELPPTTNVAIDMHTSCGAAKVAGEGIPEQIIFSPNLGSERWMVGSHASITELAPNGAAIVFGESGSEWVGGESWRHTPTTDSAPQPEECAFDPAERRVDWSEVPAVSSIHVQAIAAGIDGCFDVESMRWSGTGFDQPFTWYLCAPEPSMRLEIGEHYRLQSGSFDQVTATLIDPVTLEPRTDDFGNALLTVRWGRRQPSVPSVTGALLAPVSLDGCPWNVSEDCLEVERRLDVRIGDAMVEPGVPALHVGVDGMRHELTLARARALALSTGECGSELPYSIDYALVSEPNL